MYLHVYDPSQENPFSWDVIDERTYPFWGRLLTREQFFDRERRLRQNSWSQIARTDFFLTAGPLTTSALHPDEILGSAETYRHRVMTANGIKHIYCFASVQVPPSLSGMFLSHRMIRQIQDETIKRDPNILGFYGFSEVGERFYSRVGFRMDGFKQDLCIDTHDFKNERIQSPNLRALTRLNRTPYFDRIRELEQDGRRSILLSGQDAIPMLDPGILEWHLEREQVYVDHCFPERNPKILHGVFSRDETHYMVWYSDWRDDSLCMLLTRFQSAGQFEEMLAHAIAYAKQIGLRYFRAWLSDSALRNLSHQYPLSERLEGDSGSGDVKTLKGISWVSQPRWIWA